MKEFDVIVVGAGSGLSVASAYASKGKNVAVVEPGPMGGTCLNRGCIPSKMLIHRADVAETIKGSEEFGIHSEIHDIEFENIVEEINSEVSEDAENIEKGIRNSENHTLYKTEAEFVDEKVLEVGGEEITADKIFVAAGSRPLVPPIGGLEQSGYMTSSDALHLEEQPEDLVVIGGGYIACELAHFYQSLGTDVTIIEMGESLLKREDREVSEKFTEIASRKYNVELGLKASRVEKAGGKKKVVAEDKEGNKHSFAGEKLLVAAGRRPNTDKLNVEEAGIETDDRGFIETDEYLETNVEGVYALGDIAGNYMFKHSANLEAKHAYRNAVSGNQYPVDYTAMPHAVFSSPQISGVGKTEQELEDADCSCGESACSSNSEKCCEEEFFKATYDYSDTGMGGALKEKHGFVKVLASPEGEILGCHIIGPDASSIIHEVLVAMKAGTGKVSDIKDTIHIHPALNEVVQRAFNQL